MDSGATEPALAKPPALLTCRTLHQLFQEDYYPVRMELTFREYMRIQWREQIELYVAQGWRLIPISRRSKRPLHAQWNYESHGSHGPYLSGEAAEMWASRGFNLAAVADQGSVLWADADQPTLWRSEFQEGLVQRTPRGFALPLIPDQAFNEGVKAHVRSRGFDFLANALYELLPLSVTCALSFQHRSKPCSDHDYRVREWINPTAPRMTLSRFLEVLR
jgi:hypothetical protein